MCFGFLTNLFTEFTVHACNMFTQLKLRLQMTRWNDNSTFLQIQKDKQNKQQQKILIEIRIQCRPWISGPGFSSTSPAWISNILCSVDKCRTLCMPCSFVRFNSRTAVDGLQPKCPIRTLQSASSIIVCKIMYNVSLMTLTQIGGYHTQSIIYARNSLAKYGIIINFVHGLS